MSIEEQKSATESPIVTKLSDLKSVPNSIATVKKPVVLIAGGGVGGLTLGLALQRAGIEFLILERSATIKHVGGSLSISPNILPALEQLGLLDDIKAIGLPFTILELYAEDLKYTGSFDEQNEESVVVRTADDISYRGDILIGADGAYSAVRQSLYKELDKKGILPDEDKKEMTMAYISMLGITKPLSPEKYPCLKEEYSNCATVLAKGKPHAWTVANHNNNRLGWVTWFQVTREEAQQMMFRNSEWGSEANEALLEQIRGYPVKQGGTLGDLID
ncbi:hypothetical protein BG004_006469, partial [Podila humilis]